MQFDPKILEISDEVKILIVEDSKVALDYLKKILELEFNSIYTAEDGEIGLLRFKEILPEIVITDIRMPSMDGLKMIEHMKAIKEDFYPIVLTAYEEREILKESIDKRVYKYLVKPVVISELYEILHEIKTQILLNRKIQFQNNLINKIFSSLECIVSVSNGKELFALNTYGLDFLGFKSLLDFKSHYKCICEFFIEKEGYIHNHENWLNEVLELPVEKRKVVMRNPKTNEEHVFSVSAKWMESDKYFVTYYDITIQEKQKEVLKRVASVDFLTGIYNRQYFHNFLNFHIEKHKRYKDSKTFGILLLDIDHFKKVNDQYGHLIGDEVLKEFCRVISFNIRKSDLFARWGGEEFIILAPEINYDHLVMFGDKIRTLIETHFRSIDLPTITVSVGISLFQENDDINSFLKRADEALYLAKSKGRNRVEIL
ncbi:MAG: diguanylate cyclase [Leptospiraceae bacterium]|nr:diguanylate cyclase [Leptospiraceae bacterium]